MCGISAIVGSENQSSKQLEKMLEAIAYRGEPSHFNEGADFGFCVLGMNRLAIVDREKAIQPITSADDRYTIVFNGEIYNYKELKTQLEGLGFNFNTDSDTEVLVNGYAAWGKDMLPKLRGMFAFLIYDKSSNGFFAARDPFGIKPLYYARDSDGVFYFASEIKAIAFIERVSKIELFPPASCMENGNLSSYWKIPDKIILADNEDELVAKIRILFDQAVKRRVQTDLPVAVYLSGGLDSTAVLATACKYHNDITAIIVGSEESSDRKTATRYCEENKIKYVVQEPPSEEELSKQIPEIIRLTESFEPNMIRQGAVSYYIAKAAADKGFKIILCGEGADEIFAGYPEFTQNLKDEEIERRIRQFVKDLHRTQLQRVDRTSMAFTTEVRVPFLDLDFAEFALQIPAEFKIVKENGKTITKYMLRKAMQDRLPDYICNRDKVVLSEGAGFKGNQRIGGLFYDIVSSKVSDVELVEYKNQFPDWNIDTKEEVYYFKLYKEFGYLKAEFNKSRTSVNKTNTVDKTLEQKILKQFNTWSFKREHPKDEGLLIQAINRATKKNQPIPFALYWGKGERDFPSEAEKSALRLLNSLNERIKEVYSPGAKFTLILTDTHAELNGFNGEGIRGYYSAIQKMASENGFESLFMSELAPFNEMEPNQYDSLQISDEVRSILKTSAEKHYKSSSDYNLGATLYFAQNQVEKIAVEKRFPDSIFITYSGSDLNDIFPNLPTFYMYSTQRGVSSKPWFI